MCIKNLDCTYQLLLHYSDVDPSLKAACGISACIAIHYKTEYSIVFGRHNSPDPMHASEIHYS